MLRNSAGASLAEVARDLSMSKTHLWHLEIGTSTNPSLELLQRLADYYGTSISVIVGEGDMQADRDSNTALLLGTFRRLNATEQKALLGLMVAFDHRTGVRERTNGKTRSKQDRG